MYLDAMDVLKTLIDMYLKDDWQLKKEKKGHKIEYITEYLPDPKGNDERIKTVRSEIIMNCAPANVYEAIMHFDHVYNFDSFLKSHEVLEDYGEDAPLVGDDDTSTSCPINFARPQTALSGSAAIAASLRDEIARLQPWYDRHIKEHGRTLYGASTLALDDVVDAIAAMFADVMPPPPVPDASLGEGLRLVIDDLKAFYVEAMMAQPGTSPNDSLVRWFWDETTAGAILLDLKERCLAAEDEEIKLLGSVFLVPRSKVDRDAV